MSIQGCRAPRELGLRLAISLLGFAAPSRAFADPPPDLHALLTCDPAHGHFALKTRASGYPFDDTSDQTADPDVTTSLPLWPKSRSECRLPGFHVAVSTQDYRGSQERGECATWDKGRFVITINGKQLTSLWAPTCVQTIRNDLDIQVKSPKKGSIQLWIIHCAYDSDSIKGFEETSSCEKLALP